MMSAPAPQTTPVTALSLLIDWANQQDHWVRQLVGEIIETRRLSDARVDALYQMLLREKGLVESDAVNVPLLSESVVSTPVQTSVCLQSLKHLENVNALAADQEVGFHPRLTVCFGENASGKTGYVRILKRAASVRTADPVLSNVHASSDAVPRASIKLLVGNEERVIEWQGEQGVEPLTRLDVFDARSAVVHLTDDLTYSYTPSELSLFPLVADAVERVQTKLQSARDERRPRTNLFVNRFARESSLYAKIEGLGASTDLPELRSLASVTGEEESTLPGLREKVEALRTGSVRGQIERAEQEQNLLEQTINIANVVAAVDRAAYEDGLSKLRRAHATHERATREALAGEEGMSR